MIEEIKLLKVDNELNERFLRKNDPELLNGILIATETEKRKTKIQFADSVHEHETHVGAQTGNSSENSRNVSFNDSHSRAGSTASSVGTFRSGRHANLSFVIKWDICDVELGIELVDLKSFEQIMRTQFCELLAEMEEIKLATQDIRYATDMFKDFVICKGKKIEYFMRGWKVCQWGGTDFRKSEKQEI